MLKDPQKCKVACKVCGCRWFVADLLVGRNPFDDAEEIYGCPDCKSIDSVVAICDEPGCWNEVTAGTPTLTGYRNTCSDHAPNKEDSNA